MKKSILFVNPDYHCTFLYRDALRKLGWKADIYVPKGYPEKLLYDTKDIITVRKNIPKYFKPFYNLFVLISFLFRYKYIFIYGYSIIPIVPENIEKLFGENFKLDLALSKLFRRRLIYLPSGCLDIDLKANISKYDNGMICNNCGWGETACNDVENRKKFSTLRRYFDIYIGFPEMESTQYPQTTIKYKAVDLSLWKPGLEIPEEFRLPPTKNLRILHSFFNENRENDGKNIKGSPFIIAAIERLRNEGYNVEYMYITDVPSRYMRYYQAQADIVVEQLIYGWWGSTGVETMALGKPVICYLRDDAKRNFFKHFPEYDALPIIEANISNIYDVLKKTVEDEEFRKKKSEESRRFAESFFDIEKNSRTLDRLLREEE